MFLLGLAGFVVVHFLFYALLGPVLFVAATPFIALAAAVKSGRYLENVQHYYVRVYCFWREIFI